MPSRSSKSTRKTATPTVGSNRKKLAVKTMKGPFWKKPEKGGKPERIKTKNPPGGPDTPGEKEKRKGK